MATVTIVVLCGLLLPVAAVPETTNELAQENDCPLWYQKNKTTGECVCGNALNGVIKCHPHNHMVSIRTCYCMTMDEDMTMPVVSSCLYTCHHLHRLFKKKSIRYYIGTNSTSDITNETCGKYYREGVLCSKCIQGYCLPVYSYSISCVPCEVRWYNWVQYLALVYLPLTVFVLLIIVFRFSANSGSIAVYVTLSQMLSNKSIVSLYIEVFKPYSYIRIVSAFYSLWNLDAFRAMNSDVCLHPNLSRLHILLLDYLVALYPILLVAATYAIVYIHGKSRFVLLCRPFLSCLYKIKKEWNIKHSLIEAFATLILLSYVKILNTSFEALDSTHYYDMNHTSGPRLTLADPSLKYLSKEHWPVFMVAIIMSFTFNFLPFLVLCLYPYRCTHRFLNYYGLNSVVLHTFMDAFRGCYKIKPIYLQSFPAVLLLANFFSLLIYFALDNMLYHTGISYLLIALAFLLVVLAPYNNKKHNVINILLIIATFLANYAGAVIIESELMLRIGKSYWVFFNVLVLHVGLSSLPLYGLFHFLKFVLPKKLKNYLCTTINKKLFQLTFQRSENHMEQLPHRSEYQILPSN